MDRAGFSPPSLSFSVALSAGPSFFRSGSSLDLVSASLFKEFCIQFFSSEADQIIHFFRQYGWLRSTLRRSTFKSERLNREIRFPAVPSPSIWSFFLPYKPCSYEWLRVLSWQIVSRGSSHPFVPMTCLQQVLEELELFFGHWTKGFVIVQSLRKSPRHKTSLISFYWPIRSDFDLIYPLNRDGFHILRLAIPRFDFLLKLGSPLSWLPPTGYVVMLLIMLLVH